MHFIKQNQVEAWNKFKWLDSLIGKLNLGSKQNNYEW